MLIQEKFMKNFMSRFLNKDIMRLVRLPKFKEKKFMIASKWLKIPSL